MSTLIELSKKWEGNVIHGRFPLQQWLGGSERSAVFLTQRRGSLKAAIKLVPAEASGAHNPEEDAQLSRWAEAANRSHPNLVRLFESGRCEIDNTRLLYVVMEYAEEDLGQILPLRALSPAEALGVLGPATEALAFLHQAGFVHTRIKPSNIMAVADQVKISCDRLRKIGELRDTKESTGYSAPDPAIAGVSPATDVWSLGLTVVAVMTQREPQARNPNQGREIPETIPEPLHEIVRQCLNPDPRQRCSIDDIRRRIGVQKAPLAKLAEKPKPAKRSNRWLVPVGVVAAVLLAFGGVRFMVQQGRVASSATPPAAPMSAPAEAPPERSPAPFSATPKAKTTPQKAGKGSVLQRVMPEVSRGALSTITGRVKVSVRVAVDASGNVSEATFVSAGPSKYFAAHSLAAAQRWRFNPPQVNGQPSTSEWILHFQFGRGSVEALPTETKP